MSANEVIEQIKQLPREEQRQVALFIQTLEQQGSAGSPARGVSAEFKQIADEVFTTNAELFKKLAQ
jgi:hypothetical protein